MKFDPNKIIIEKQLTTEQGLAVYDTLKTLMDSTEDDCYYYVDIINFQIRVDSVRTEQVEWYANQLNCTEKEAMTCLSVYPGFLYDLNSILYFSGINNLKRYEAEVSKDPIENFNTYQEYGDFFGKSKKEALMFFRDILEIENLIDVKQYSLDVDGEAGLQN